jgi:hypothetical protein
MPFEGRRTRQRLWKSGQSMESVNVAIYYIYVIRLFSNGAIGNESQEKLLKELHEKVKEVYQTCIGDYETNVGALQMLTSIENKLEQLFEVIEMMPIEKVEQAEKVNLDACLASTTLMLFFL